VFALGVCRSVAVIGHLTPRLSGVASFEWTTEVNEDDAGHVTSAAEEESHVHSNRLLCGSDSTTCEFLSSPLENLPVVLPAELLQRVHQL
jgi:hypothetical protein